MRACSSPTLVVSRAPLEQLSHRTAIAIRQVYLEQSGKRWGEVEDRSLPLQQVRPDSWTCRYEQPMRSVLARTAILIDALDDPDLGRADADDGGGAFPNERTSGRHFVAPLH